MDAKTDLPETPKWMYRTGIGFTALPGAMLVFSAVMKLARAPEVTDTLVGKFGFAEGAVVGIGVLELFCVALYLVPQTAVLGALLLTGYLGGAVATHLRVGDPFLAPAILGVALWAGIYLRDARLRELLPLRRQRRSDPSSAPQPVTAA